MASKQPLRSYEKNGQTHSVGTLEVVDDQVYPPHQASPLTMRGLCIVPVTMRASAAGWHRVDLPDMSFFMHLIPSSIAEGVACMQGTSIEVTLWRGIADKFYDHIEEGQVRHLYNQDSRTHWFHVTPSASRAFKLV